ncbi:unnamed protein product [Camellia sinensis]
MSDKKQRDINLIVVRFERPKGLVGCWTMANSCSSLGWAAKLNQGNSSFVAPNPIRKACSSNECESTCFLQHVHNHGLGLGLGLGHGHGGNIPSCSFGVEGIFKEHHRAAATIASNINSHSQAEKRRRDRINAQLSILRKLIPKSDKMDKAALLGSVVEHVKDLKRKAMEISKVITVPTDVDEVTINYYYLDDDDQDGRRRRSSTIINGNNVFIKASVCCDDRPELFAELTQALSGLKLSTVRADMACLGGRIKSILVLCTKDSKEVVSMNNVIQSLNGVLNRIASSSTGSNHRVKSKRQRFFLPSY